MGSYIRYKVVIKDFEILDIDNNIIKDGEIYYNDSLEVKDKKIVLTTTLQKSEEKGNIFMLEINSNKDMDERDLMPLALNIVYNLLNKISFYFQNAKISEPWVVATDFKDEKMDTIVIAASTFITTKERDKNLLEGLCKEIDGDKDFTTDNYNLFRVAMNNEDVAIKYMFLYQILLINHLNGKGRESQKSVDEFIRDNTSKEKHMYKKWDDSGWEETIYTRLRNQIGHFRGKTPQETRNEMNARISELIELVKISIRGESI